jgi:LysR family transcriptional regulator, hypochlorite-specific transcription factor HypT
MELQGMNLTWIRDLEHVARTGSFSQAASRSNLSQPALSRRIKAMEAWVGAILVERSRHPVTLTGAGVQMLEAGQQALERLNNERKSIREARSLPDRHVVTFAAQHSIAWQFYPAWLQAFEVAYGPILSRLRADDLPNCLQDLKAGHVDFVIGYESRRSSIAGDLADGQSISIGRDALIPVAKMGPDGRTLFSLDRKSASTIPYIQFGATAPIAEHIAPLLKTGNLRSRLDVVYENSMAGALRIRVRDGAGVAWLPKSLVSNDLDAGLLGLAGGKRWEVALDVKLVRRRQLANPLTSKIWTFLERRKSAPLLASVRTST